ncbi:MAG: hypothetical protein KBC96_12125 [Armatimonadetes bacterium]|nr:hypothetical protein [Armatimonadota bacterium]
MTRLADLRRFYRTMEDLERKVGGCRSLMECTGNMHWPRRGVYFFFEKGQVRSDTGVGLRVVRVGTHALKANSATTLWSRLRAHRGRACSGAGNHRASVFRLLVGQAVASRDGVSCGSWGRNVPRQERNREEEIELERLVSLYIGGMPFLWLEADDAPGPDSVRGYIERNAIALLSNFGKEELDPPSDGWLGRNCPKERIRSSGLWNSNHVDEDYDRTFLDDLASLVSAT